MGIISSLHGVAVTSTLSALSVTFRQWGEDCTVATEQRPVLVLAPHPDDETLGCGATIARKRRAGAAVRVVVVADGRHGNPSTVISPADLARIRADEAVAACGVLGVPPDDVVHLGHCDGGLRAAEDELTRQLEAMFDAAGPIEVFTTAPSDPHPDHAALGRAAFRAAIGRPVTLLAYPIWQWKYAYSWFVRSDVAVDGHVQRLRPTFGVRPSVVRTGEFVEAKREALLAHRSQMTKLTGETDWAVLDPRFVARFMVANEVFFPFVTIDGRRRAGAM